MALSRPFIQRVKVGLDVCKAAILAASRDSYHDSLTDYVNALPAWDCQPRLDRWLTTYVGAQDNRVNKWIGRSWLIACIARALQPGCVGDAMLVLEGLEAVGKNRLVDTLFGGRPWVGSLGSYRIGKDREADRIAGACWILHVDELTGMSHASKEAIKSWLTRSEDPYRIPYEAGITYAPRRCIAIGSTNEHEYLEDDQTGATGRSSAASGWGAGSSSTSTESSATGFSSSPKHSSTTGRERPGRSDESTKCGMTSYRIKESESFRTPSWRP